MTVRNLNSDQFALLEFKDRIAGPQNVLANNWTASTSVCNWVGVSCGILHKRVIALNLTSMNLRGTIPETLVNMSNLENLNLGFNQLSGQVPSSIFKISSLMIIDLSSSSLSGQIPTSIFNISSLKTIDLSSNSLSGSLPND
ncbi:hypothetical protein Gotur_024175, partial [Gossypium turneri]